MVPRAAAAGGAGGASGAMPLAESAVRTGLGLPGAAAGPPGRWALLGVALSAVVTAGPQGCWRGAACTVGRSGRIPRFPQHASLSRPCCACTGRAARLASIGRPAAPRSPVQAPLHVEDRAGPPARPPGPETALTSLSPVLAWSRGYHSPTGSIGALEGRIRPNHFGSRAPDQPASGSGSRAACSPHASRRPARGRQWISAD